jgi:hypothetical protein
MFVRFFGDTHKELCSEESEFISVLNDIFEKDDQRENRNIEGSSMILSGIKYSIKERNYELFHTTIWKLERHLNRLYRSSLIDLEDLKEFIEAFNKILPKIDMRYAQKLITFRDNIMFQIDGIEMEKSRQEKLTSHKSEQ